MEELGKVLRRDGYSTKNLLSLETDFTHLSKIDTGNHDKQYMSNDKEEFDCNCVTIR
ncbi:unnamed protein product, partial [Rotaria sp. Silwood1]